MGRSQVAGWLLFDNINNKLGSTVTLNANGSGGSTLRTLTVNTGINVTNSSTNTVFIQGADGGINYVMGGNNTFTVSSGATLVFGPTVTMSGAFSATKNGAGALTLTPWAPAHL